MTAEHPSPFYHYTSIDALLSILKPPEKVQSIPEDGESAGVWGSMWATDVAYMVDREELQHGRDRLVDFMLERAAVLEAADRPDGYGSGDPMAQAGFLRDTASRLADGLGREEPSDVFVLSFCLKPDLRSQWDVYGGRSGVAMKFSSPETFEAPLPFFSGLPEFRYSAGSNGGSVHAMWKDFVKVKYTGMSEADMKAVAARIAPPGSDDSASKWHAYSGYNMALLALASMKQASFEDEHEKRLIFTRREMTGELPTQFRSKDGLLVPYVVVPLSLAGLEEICIGPGSDQGRVLGAVKALLRRLGATQIPVVASTLAR